MLTRFLQPQDHPPAVIKVVIDKESKGRTLWRTLSGDGADA